MVYFFVRYWRHCVTHLTFNLKNNFITNNTYIYMCIEINAQALIEFIYRRSIYIRDFFLVERVQLNSMVT